MRKRRLNRQSVTACIFCGLLFVFFGLFFLPDQSFSETEKRVLAQFPTVRFSSVINGKTESELETYLQDQMPFRNFWVGLCAYFNAAAGQNGTDGVYSAADGYLIGTPITQNDRNLRSNLRYLNTFAEQTDVPCYLMVVPQTGYVLQDKLPNRHAPYTDDALMEDIRKAVQFSLLDLREALKEAAPSSQVFYRTDHHWTSDGALIAANAFLRAKGKPALSKAEFSVESVPGFYGTTYSRAALWGKQPDTMELWTAEKASVSVEVSDLGSGKTMRRNDVFFREHLEKVDRYPVYLNGNHSLTRIVNEAVPDGTLLLVKDSFGNTLATELAARYHEILMVDMRYYRTAAVSDLMARQNVDSVLFCYSMDDIVNDQNILWLK